MSDCNAVADALSEGRPLDDAMRAHTSGCARCNALTATDDALAAMLNEAAPEEGPMPAALRALIASESTPVAPFSTWRRAVGPLAVAGLVVAAGLVFKPRADLAHQPRAAFATSALVLGVLIAAGVVASLHRGARGLGVPLGERAFYMLGAVALAEVSVAQGAGAVEGSVVLAPGEVGRGLAHCASLGTAIALLVGVALFAVARRTAVTAPAAAGAVAGAAAGLVGTLTLHVICPIATLEHAMIGHVFPALAGAALGALVGRRALSV